MRFSRRGLLGVSLLALAACGPRPLASAIEAHEVWVRAAPIAGGHGAAYLRLVNRGGATDRLLGARCARASSVEVHSMAMDHGVMRMSPLPALEIPPSGEVLLAPGGTHLMLLSMPEVLPAGSRLPLVLRFERAGEVTVEAAVHRLSPQEG